jgi:amidophosphoribosyltransferase
MLRESGVAEVHLRITSPPVKWPCFYGIDTGTRSELLGANLTVEEIREYLNVDSLAYLTLDRLTVATDAPGAGFCNACFTGTYPVEVPVELAKGVLEGDDDGGSDVRQGGLLGTAAVPLLGRDASVLPADDARGRDGARG